MNDFVQTWWPVFAAIVGVLVGAAIYWVRNSTKAQIETAYRDLRTINDAACGKLDTRLDEHHDRISKLEGKVDDLPKVADIHNLAMSLERLSGEVRAQGVKLGSVQETSIAMQKSVQRINDFLLNEKS